MKVGRNDPCPCGSGAKYKKCCFSVDQAAALAASQARAVSRDGPESPQPKSFTGAKGHRDQARSPAGGPKQSAGRSLRRRSV
jgi:hypothetical protein